MPLSSTRASRGWIWTPNLGIRVDCSTTVLLQQVNKPTNKLNIEIFQGLRGKAGIHKTSHNLKLVMPFISYWSSLHFKVFFNSFNYIKTNVCKKVIRKGCLIVTHKASKIVFMPIHEIISLEKGKAYKNILLLGQGQ